MTLTIKGSCPGTILDSAGAAIAFNAIRANLYAEGDSTVVGFSDAVTRDSAGIISFSPSGTYLASKLYDIALVKQSGGELLTRRSKVWIEAPDGTFVFGSGEAVIRFGENLRQFPPQVRSIDDTQPLFFVWPGGSGKSLTAQRSINGAALVNTDGTVTQTGVEQTVPGRYRLNYSAADRAVGSVSYKFTDSADATKTGVLAVTFLPASGSGNATESTQNQILALLTSGQAVTNSPVTPTGTIASAIVIGDDYLASNARAFNWTVAVPAGFALNQATCWFGGGNKAKGKWLVQGTVTAVTVDGQPRWQMSFNLPAAATGQCKPGCYDWSVELRGPSPEHITKLLGQVDLVEAYTR